MHSSYISKRHHALFIRCVHIIVYSTSGLSLLLKAHHLVMHYMQPLISGYRVLIYCTLHTACNTLITHMTTVLIGTAKSHMNSNVRCIHGMRSWESVCMLYVSILYSCDHVNECMIVVWKMQSGWETWNHALYLWYIVCYCCLAHTNNSIRHCQFTGFNVHVHVHVHIMQLRSAL